MALLEERKEFGRELMKMVDEEICRKREIRPGRWANLFLFKNDDFVKGGLSMRYRPGDFPDAYSGHCGIDFYYKSDGVYTTTDLKLTKGLLRKIERKVREFMISHGYPIPKWDFKEVTYTKPMSTKAFDKKKERTKKEKEVLEEMMAKTIIAGIYDRKVGKEVPPKNLIGLEFEGGEAVRLLYTKKDIQGPFIPPSDIIITRQFEIVIGKGTDRVSIVRE